MKGVYLLVLRRLRRLRRSHSSQGVQDERSANTEADHGGKRHQIQHAALHSQEIREKRQHGTENTEDIKPERRTNARKIPAKPNLEQYRGQSDRGHYNQSKGTVKSIRPGKDYDQGKRQQEQTGGDHG